ncbi:hypothetical protein OQA88_11581 [Cercophora sp. LCS_1]
MRTRFGFRVAALLALGLHGPATALIGYGIVMYDPSCGFACRDSISGYVLECSVHDHGPAGAHSHGAGGPTSPECRASDSAFLTTLAYCINSTCDTVPAWKKEKYWADQATGDPAVSPKWTLSEALANIREAPSREVGEDESLNFTALVSYETWATNKATREYFELAETLHSRYGIILLVVGVGTPILFTLMSHVPFAATLTDKLRPFLVYPSIVGSYHVRPLPYLLGNAPTLGQSLYITMMLALSVILTGVGYRSTQPNAWFDNTWQEIMGYVSCRTGVLAFALTPHSTYMLLHRWVARIYALQVIVHSLVELVLYIDRGTYETELKAEYWIWGIVATVSACAMLVFSHLWFRRWSYEIFLIGHVLMAVFVIVGSWYHVELLFHRQWGYEMWLYAACAVWFTDRLVRAIRLLKNGVRRAVVTEVAEDVVRVDVKGLRWSGEPGKHTYAYFPILAPWRPWENHPFSVIPTAMLRPRDNGSVSHTPTEHDVEKSGAGASVIPEAHLDTFDRSGITLYVRRSAGLTKLLAKNQSLLTLLDGPYPDNPTAGVLKTDRLLLIAGGIGITGVLPYITRHPNVKIAWGLRLSSEGLARDLDAPLQGVADREVRIGSRLDLEALLEEEVRRGWARVGVVACGPGGLCDEVRALAVAKGRTGSTRWELEIDSFSW